MPRITSKAFCSIEPGIAGLPDEPEFFEFPDSEFPRLDEVPIFSSFTLLFPADAVEDAEVAVLLGDDCTSEDCGVDTFAPDEELPTFPDPGEEVFPTFPVSEELTPLPKLSGPLEIPEPSALSTSPLPSGFATISELSLSPVETLGSATLSPALV